MDDLRIFGTVYRNVTGIKATDTDGVIQTFINGQGTVDGDELGYGDLSNLVGYGLVGSLVVDSYGYGYADYFVVADDEEEGENDGI